MLVYGGQSHIGCMLDLVWVDMVLGYPSKQLAYGEIHIRLVVLDPFVGVSFFLTYLCGSLVGLVQDYKLLRPFNDKCCRGNEIRPFCIDLFCY